MYKKILHPIHCFVKKFDWLCIALASSWCMCIFFHVLPFLSLSLSCLRWTEFKSLFLWLLLSRLLLLDVPSITNFVFLFAYLYHKFEWRQKNLKSRGKWVTMFLGERAFPCLLLSLPSCLFSLPLLLSIEKVKVKTCQEKSLIHSMQSNYKRGDQRSLLLLELDGKEEMPMLTSLSLFSCVLSCGWFLSSSLCLLPCLLPSVFFLGVHGEDVVLQEGDAVMIFHEECKAFSCLNPSSLHSCPLLSSDCESCNKIIKYSITIPVLSLLKHNYYVLIVISVIFSFD